jgi:hypothetical protein
MLHQDGQDEQRLQGNGYEDRKVTEYDTHLKEEDKTLNDCA